MCREWQCELLGMDAKNDMKQPVYPCTLTPSTATSFRSLPLATPVISFSNPHGAQLQKVPNYPIPVISLRPPQKAQIARKLGKPRFNQYHMVFYLFTVTFLPKQGLWIPRAVNSTVFMFQRCWAVSWHVARTNIIITNSVLWTGQGGGGDAALSFSVFPQALSVTFQGHGKVLKYTDKETFNPLIALQGGYRLGRRSGT